MSEKIFDFLKDNFRNPKLYIVLLASVFLFLLLFPYIDANIFYYSRVEKRISILQEISEIDQEALKNSPVLAEEYESILFEISKQKDGSIGSIFISKTTKEIQQYKFISGGFLSWLLALICLFMKIEKASNKIIGIFFFLILGCGLGYIAQLFPIIIQPVCNYIGVPLLQFILLGILAMSMNKKKLRSNT